MRRFTKSWSRKPEENGNIKYLKTFDTHLGEYGSPEDGDGENGPVNMSDEEREAVRQDMQGAVEQAARQAGKMPGALGRMIDQILNPSSTGASSWLSRSRVLSSQTTLSNGVAARVLTLAFGCLP